jgi:hypothetical protein
LKRLFQSATSLSLMAPVDVVVWAGADIFGRVRQFQVVWYGMLPRVESGSIKERRENQNDAEKKQNHEREK